MRRHAGGVGRGRAAAALLALIVVLGAVVSARDLTLVAYSGANGKIAFETTRDGNLEIYVMEPDGSGQTNITNDPAEDTDPVWSPDGTRIAFVKASEGHRNIYVMNADGSGQTNLTPGPETTGQANGGTNPTWSPDGSRIAYDHGGGDIWVMNADGSGKTNLTNTPVATGVEGQPAWSPDGTQIAYVRNADIWVMNADGTGQKPLTSTTGPGQDEKAPDWSPDGTRIVYGKGSGIWVMNADGSGQTQLAANGVLPSWSPDGTKIVFSSSAFGAPNGPDIFVMNPDGSGVTRLPTAVPATDTNPTWQPVATPATTTSTTTTSTTTTTTTVSTTTSTSSTTTTTSTTSTSTTTTSTSSTSTSTVPSTTSTSTSSTSTSTTLATTTTSTSTSTSTTTTTVTTTIVPPPDTDPEPTPPDTTPPDAPPPGTVPVDPSPPSTVAPTTVPPTTLPPTTAPPTTAVPPTAPLTTEPPEPDPVPVAPEEPEPEDASPASAPPETVPADSPAAEADDDEDAPVPLGPGVFVPFQAAPAGPSTTSVTVPSPASTTPSTVGTQTEAAAPPSPTPNQVQQPATLVAVSPDGVASGPPGVGLQVTGSDYPADCETVYFFFDGTRVGSARPDDGAVRKMTLSVPGGTDEGTHRVTSSCRSSGDPVLSSTEFLVTEDSLHRSGFATALPRTDHVSFDLGRVLLSALAVLGLLLLIAFPAELFNSTLEEHYDEVRGWFGLRPRRPGAGTGVPNVAVFALFVLLSGPLCFAMLSSSALDVSTAVAALGLSLATGVVVLGSDLPTFAHLRRRYRETASVVALPGSLVVTVACVVLSRAVHFEPGYFYGLVGGLAFARELRRDTTGRLAASSAVVLLALSVAAWVALGPVSDAASQPEAGLVPIFAESFLGGIFWVALDSLVIALLPLRLLTGNDIARWSRRAWAVLYAVALFAFVHILLRPSTGYVADTSRSPTLVVVGLFVAFGVFSFAFWAYFQYRAPRATEPAPARVE